MDEGLRGAEDLREFVETFNVICPACGGGVEVKRDASGLKCVKCRRVYPVNNGIPSLIVEEAVVEDEESPNPA
jgi:uncharacterized protein YbaR (Trm112 family)